jgi:hypothetical protein
MFAVFEIRMACLFIVSVLARGGESKSAAVLGGGVAEVAIGPIG